MSGLATRVAAAILTAAALMAAVVAMAWPDAAGAAAREDWTGAGGASMIAPMRALEVGDDGAPEAAEGR